MQPTACTTRCAMRMRQTCRACSTSCTVACGKSSNNATRRQSNKAPRHDNAAVHRTASPRRRCAGRHALPACRSPRAAPPYTATTEIKTRQCCRKHYGTTAPCRRTGAAGKGRVGQGRAVCVPGQHQQCRRRRRAALAEHDRARGAHLEPRRQQRLQCMQRRPCGPGRARAPLRRAVCAAIGLRRRSRPTIGSH